MLLSLLVKAVLAGYVGFALVQRGRRLGAQAGTECGRDHEGACRVELTWLGWRCRR